MRIRDVAIYVDDQAKALDFYTRVLGFRKKTEIPLGDVAWLTVVSPEDPNGPAILLEPEGHPAVAPFKRALLTDGVPYATFIVDDVRTEHRRLSELDVHFQHEPSTVNGTTMAVLDDTCGNLIAITSG
ncbi:VOC family protein [Spiractinospora alimapuensis]|uniref:VOC family protein n=1 Tax=Spiractinospora alimapuensis TaxID=2820884 RepID=UPI001F2FBC61|nr:VOC family protein [Spiractinospora alimapuensis]QVQ50047.1 VOC family protein [Spiractinospora alimapuensis]